MSNINAAIYTFDEQLFTELTPEEGAFIEGGARLILYNATAIQARADGNWKDGNGDDLYIVVNGIRLPGTYNDVDTGESINISRTINFTGTARVNLFDDDPSSSSADDYLGGFTVGDSRTGQKTVRVTKGGSIYDVLYKVIA
ncbi:hypothetical protein IQ277_02290 [Nostocales cyanobacterium LEGE 12452]|nr:hypothetical protein [Nostocales cyanobacterium LEGE 12452]